MLASRISVFFYYTVDLARKVKPRLGHHWWSGAMIFGNIGSQGLVLVVCAVSERGLGLT